MNEACVSQLTYQGNLLDMTFVGELRRSIDVINDRDELWTRMGEDGYLFLPGLLDPEKVLIARKELCDRLFSAGLLEKSAEIIEGIAAPSGQNKNAFMPELARNNKLLDVVLYEGAMIDFYTMFLGGEVRHFDYTWFRVKPPGIDTATTPHQDNVYMGRGTKNLFTSWIPFGDIPFEMGGLMILEGSHCHAALVNGYGQTDVDAYCVNEGDASTTIEAAQSDDRELTDQERSRIKWNSTGAYSNDAIETQREWGGRWLTSEYEMGDVLIFCMHIMHASSDNQTDRIRLSSDSRYQLAEESIDERWIGEDPPAHGIRAKRGMIC
ncbi:MAG: phytanoyl-CoA dioxygenase family protein [Candidatus Latescibacterota bacterium]|nr:phytanoyl-CoA dioxygenase family protein [Candidatus Latescibacterota bacterium]